MNIKSSLTALILGVSIMSQSLYAADTTQGLTSKNVATDTAQRGNKNFRKHPKRMSSELFSQKMEFYKEFKENETKLFQNINELDKAEAEKVIDDFYSNAFVNLPKRNSKTINRIIESIEELELPTETKELVINKIKSTTSSRKLNIEQKAKEFAKSLLDLPPEKREKAIADYNKWVEFHILHMGPKNKFDGMKRKGMMRDKRMQPHGQFRNMQNHKNNGMRQSKMPRQDGMLPMTMNSPMQGQSDMPPMAINRPIPEQDGMPPMAMNDSMPRQGGMPPMPMNRSMPRQDCMSPMAMNRPMPEQDGMPPMPMNSPMPRQDCMSPMAMNRPMPEQVCMPPVPMNRLMPRQDCMSPITMNRPMPRFNHMFAKFSNQPDRRMFCMGNQMNNFEPFESNNSDQFERMTPNDFRNTEFYQDIQEEVEPYPIEE